MQFFFFFFQAEDGIRDLTVTGVQTCALPISAGLHGRAARLHGLESVGRPGRRVEREPPQIGRGACRGRGEISGVAVSLKKKKKKESVIRRVRRYETSSYCVAGALRHVCTCAH